MEGATNPQGAQNTHISRDGFLLIAIAHRPERYLLAVIIYESSRERDTLYRAHKHRFRRYIQQNHCTCMRNIYVESIRKTFRRIYPKPSIPDESTNNTFLSRIIFSVYRTYLYARRKNHKR